MALGAIFIGNDVIFRLATQLDIVMTGLALVDNAVVTEAYTRPVCGLMAGVTIQIGQQVFIGHAFRVLIVMTGATGLGSGAMIHRRITPAMGVMTTAALIVGDRDMLLR